MVGNDIVDLKHAALESNWQRKGFLNKVFTSSEKQYIQDAENPFQMVWLIWSMKESAYKIIYKSINIGFLIQRNWPVQS